MAASPDALSASLRVFEDYARSWRFSANHGKSNVLIFGPKRAKALTRNYVWLLDGAPVPRALQYKYLGLEFVEKRSTGKWNVVLARLTSKARAGLNLLMYQGGGANGVRPRTMCHQWSMLCRPILEYGCEIWHGEISNAMD